ncbi:MAG: hypothetical protein RIB03_15715 [Henriciella sp.]|uniref:hypothetical protein n=1 Tax=Henriciella sp. TaxID=1968823 RepID=UPI002606F838|nr:hypothetical protein [Henriciella sp.]
MSKSIITACAAITAFSLPAFADDARTPPTTPYYAPATQACEEVNLTIYFEPGTADLTPFARDAIRETREQLSGCSVTSIDGTATANDADTDADKLTLADARRAEVMKALAAHGIRSAQTNLKTNISASEKEAIMARNVGLTLETTPAQVG